jgi:hypothetical protein
MDRLLGRSALPINGHSRHAVRQFRGENHIARERERLFARLRNAAKHDVLDSGWIEARAVDERVHNLSAEIGRVPSRQFAAAPASGRAHSLHDISFAHTSLLRCRSRSC